MIIEREGIKIGIVGSALENTPALSSSGPLKFAPTVATVAAATKALKDQGADITVAVVHADKETGQKLMAAKAADIILSGHNHDLHIDFDGRTALTESGEDANYVVAVDVKVTIKGEGAARTVSWWPTYRVFDTADVTPDPEMLQKVKAYESELSRELDVSVAKIEAPLDSRSATVRGGEAAIGNLIADAVRIQNNAEIGIVNGGGIRDTFPAKTYAPADKSLVRPGTNTTGPYDVTLGDAMTVFPFGNYIATTKMTGADIWKAIENGVSQYPTAGRFPQISGFKFAFDPSKAVGSRVSSIKTLDGSDIPNNASAEYTVSTLDYMVSGGDGYVDMFHPATAKIGGLLVDVLVAGLKADLAAGKVTQLPKLDGRITKP